METMKRTLLLLILGAVLTCPSSFAQAADSANAPSKSPPPGGPPHGGRGGTLTDEERQELHTAHDAAFKADPSLETDGKALKDQMDAYNKKLHDAMIKADPKVEPILAKMGPGRQQHGGPDGPPPAK